MEITRNLKFQNNNAKSSFFGLTRNSARMRITYLTGLILCIFLLITGITVVSSIFTTQSTEQRFWLIVISCFKYIPLLILAYFLARQRAAKYLDDIFELNDESVATRFIQEVAFGEGEEQITIAEGKVSKSDEKSPIILIGGPGQIMVHLDNAAIMETAQGKPEVISAKNEAWKIEGFERLREIGQQDEVGKREYAIVNLRNQFVSDLNVIARTKDSIRIEIKDIKLMFSVLREHKHKANHDQEKRPFSYDENALLSLVYDQAVITQPYELPTGIKFPWDTTVIPLVIGELEKLIQSHTLSEILVSTSQKEIDEITTKEKELEKIRAEITGTPSDTQQAKETQIPSFVPRSNITENFFSLTFKQKAATLGISIEWIDIGTWEIGYSFIFDKLKEARDLAIKNAKKEKEIQELEKKLVFKEIVELTNKIIISPHYDQTFIASDLTPKELQELALIIRENPEFNNPYIIRQIIQQKLDSKTSQNKATEILKALRVKLSDAKQLIEKENELSAKQQNEHTKINNAIRDIDHHIYHMV